VLPREPIEPVPRIAQRDGESDPGADREEVAAEAGYERAAEGGREHTNNSRARMAFRSTLNQPSGR
jgi:hypothetical protein